MNKVRICYRITFVCNGQKITRMVWAKSEDQAMSSLQLDWHGDDLSIKSVEPITVKFTKSEIVALLWEYFGTDILNGLPADPFVYQYARG